MIRNIIKGTGEANILILAGVHGNELTPIYCAALLEQKLDSRKFKTCTILNCINEYGIENNTRDFKPISDINRLFSEQDNIKTVLGDEFKNKDLIIDLHSSPNISEFVLINNDDYTKLYVKFCIKHNINYVLWEGSKGSIKDYCNNTLYTPCFTIEMDGVAEVNPYSAKKSISIINTIIDNIGKLKFKSTKSKKHSFKPLEYIKAPCDGIYIDIGDITDDIFDQQECEYIDTVTGEIIEETLVFSDPSRVIQFLSGYHRQGDTLYLIQPINEL